MQSTYQYKVYLDTKQKLALNHWLRICRYWYNRQLGDRFDWWEMNPYVPKCLPVEEQYCSGAGQAYPLLSAIDAARSEKGLSARHSQR